MGEYKPIGREVVIEGYLRKAPSTEKRSRNQSLKFLCAGCHVLLEPRWKKRFCVFYKIRYPNETQIFFEYYKNESEKQPRGCIDLNSCDCIYEQKICNRWPNVFVVKTTSRNKRRDYLFSAESSEEMNKWISQLTKVLHMVPDQIPASALSDIIGRKSSTVSHLSSRKPLIHSAAPLSSKVSNFSMNPNQLDGSHDYLDRGLTEEYRTSFGEATTDDEDCYHTLPQPDHAYANLKGDRGAVGDANFLNGQDIEINNRPRPDSVYFNMWDSSTVDANTNVARVHVICHANLSESKEPGKEILDKSAKSHLQPHIPEHFSSIQETSNITQLPKRSRMHTTSSSSSEISSDDGADQGDKIDGENFIPLNGAGEAEAATSPPGDIVSPEQGEVTGVKNNEVVGATGTTAATLIHYLDAENLDFSLHQRGSRGGTNAVPTVSLKPAYLRRSTSTEAKASDINAFNDVTSSGYNELDPRSTQAFFMFTKTFFGDADGA